MFTILITVLVVGFSRFLQLFCSCFSVSSELIAPSFSSYDSVFWRYQLKKKGSKILNLWPCIFSEDK